MRIGLFLLLPFFSAAFWAAGETRPGSNRPRCAFCTARRRGAGGVLDLLDSEHRHTACHSAAARTSCAGLADGCGRAGVCGGTGAAGRSGCQLCASGQGRHEPRRAVPVVAPSDVCGVFCVFYRLCAADPVAAAAGAGAGLPDRGALDHPGGGALVCGTVWAKMAGVLQPGRTIFLMEKKRCAPVRGKKESCT